MATLFLKDGHWWLNYSLNGKRFRVATGTIDRKLAEVKLNDLKVKLFKEDMGVKSKPAKNISIAEFFNRYIKYIQSQSPVDKHAEMSRIRIFREFCARKSIKYLINITPNILDEFTTLVLVDKKPKTIKNYVTLLKTALNKAAEWQLLDYNPVGRVKSPKIVKTFHFFSEEEMAKLIDHAEEPLKMAIIILANTGMRRSELFHLRWRDVDLKNNSLRVWPYEGYSPKGKRPRNIPISNRLKKILLRLSTPHKPDGFVFRPYTHVHTLYKHFIELSTKMGIKGTLHDFRHTFASHLAMAGVPIPVISELLGHSNITTTMIYAHLSPTAHKAAIEKLPF